MLFTTGFVILKFEGDGFLYNLSMQIQTTHFCFSLSLVSCENIFCDTLNVLKGKECQ